ncbi:uncharacterized protein [Arachis hypogaea]|uniref:uncharacterized protein n=1 Tax=Arachis hypogaea TaxID=3818 RepID=UPI000DECA05C|nr:uncharacterized protein LOC112794651 [Arachis hypogaea]
MSENVGSGTGSSLPSIPRPTPAISRRKNATENRSDIGWKHGIDVQGNGKKVKCNYCSKTINGGIYRFKHHLVGTKEDSEPCASVPEEVKAVMLKVCVEDKEASLKKRRFGDDEDYPEQTKNEKDNSQQKGKDIRNFVTKEKGAQFCEMVGRYRIGYKPPSYHELRETQLKKATTNVDEMLTEFKAEWKRTDTSDISKITDKVVKMLEDAEEFVDEENVVQIVTDNDVNYKAAGEKMMKTRKNLYWTPCATHCIDLILENFKKKLKVHETTMKKGRKIITFIYSRSMLISMLRNFTKGKDLVRPGATRFATAYLTLTCLHDNKGPLMTMFTSDDWKTTKVASTPEGIRVQNIALDSRLWKNIVICLKTTAPLITVLRS